LPVIIQGGMGVAVSGWRLARAVSTVGQLGVVSGTGLDAVLARRLQLGDPDGALRSALDALPVPGVAERVLDRYFVDGGKQPDARFEQVPMGRLRPSRLSEDLLVAGSFVEVWLARQGHSNPVGINYLEKIQAPTLPSIYGAMLAGVDVVLMGAGIPRSIPGVLDELSQGRPAELRLDVSGASEAYTLRFDPEEYHGGPPPPVERPMFLAIVASHVLATMLATRVDPPADGFVIEYPTAGGHNAPPRGKGNRSESGEPLYGERDVPDLSVFRELGRPFWLAGEFGVPGGLARARAEGAVGIQVGTAFAYCDESGLRDDLKRAVLEASRHGRVEVFTDPVASPTGFPFKVVDLDDTLSDDEVYEDRSRVCDLGYLRTAVVERGRQKWRCAAEPADDFQRKGGDPADTFGRRCLCNALMATVGLGQVREDGTVEPPLVTSGDAVSAIASFVSEGADGYSAADVVDRLLEGWVNDRT
jgi:nitronate monooxygenase